MSDSQGPATTAELHLRVKTLQSATYEIDVTSQATVLEVKEKLVALTNIPTNRQRLIFRGAVLQDTQGLATAHIEDGHTLHLVERPEGVPPSAPPGQANPHQQHQHVHRINVGMIDVNGAIAASGGMNGFLQSLQVPGGHQQIQLVAHPPAGNQEGAPQMISMMGGAPGQSAPPHQLTALNNYLLHLDTATPPSSLPPFSMVSRIGQVAADEAAFVELARASLQGVELPAEVEAFVRRVQAQPQESPAPPAHPDSAQGAATGPPTGQQPAGAPGGRNANPRDPRRNGLDGAQNQGARPRPVALGNDLLRLATLAVGQVARQSLRQTQAASLPAMAAAVNRLQEQAFQPNVQASSVQEQARQISNTTYDLGCLLLELSLASANLANAAGGNAGPLISAQTGFLAADGTHAHVTNRVPSMLAPPMAGVGPMPGVPMPAGMRMNPGAFPTAQQAAAAQQAAMARGGGAAAAATGQPTGGPGASTGPGGPRATAAAGGGPGFPPPGTAVPPRTRGMDTASPLAHAYFNAITQDDETRSRHMRLPVRLADGSHFRIDMSPVVNAVETLILAAPQEVIARTLRNSLPVPMSGPEDRSLRELMTSSQTDEQRRQIYLTLTQPILAAVTDHLQAYFQHLYRVAAPRQPGEEQAAIRPTRRAASRPVPSLTHPFAIVTNPARDILRTLPPRGMEFPGAQMQVDMVLEGSMDIPFNAQEVMQAQMASMMQAGLQQQHPPPQGAAHFTTIPGATIPTASTAAAGLSGIPHPPPSGFPVPAPGEAAPHIPHMPVRAADAEARRRQLERMGEESQARRRQQEEQQERMRRRASQFEREHGNGTSGPRVAAQAQASQGQVPSGNPTQRRADPSPSEGPGPSSQAPLAHAAATTPQPAAAAGPASSVAGGENHARTAAGRVVFGDSAQGPSSEGQAPRSGVVPIGGGATIDMEWVSGMLGYPVRGPNGQMYSGRRPGTQERPLEAASATVPTASAATAASTPATVPANTPAPSQTEPAGRARSQGSQSAAAGAADGTRASGSGSIDPGQEVEHTLEGSAKGAIPPGSGASQKVEAKEGGRGLGSSLPSRKRTSPSGKDSQPAAEPQLVTSKVGPSDAARDGKKQKLQDMPSSSTADTGRPGSEGATVDPSRNVRREANVSQPDPQNIGPRAGQPLANGPGGGLANMMQQMMQTPGMQEMLQSPEVEQLTSSPALAQMMGSLFNGQRGRQPSAGAQQEVGRDSGRQQGQGTPDLGSLFQSMMPLAQQMLGGGAPGSAPSQFQRNTLASGDAAASASGSGDMPELRNLPEEDAERWRSIIRGDREKADNAPKSLSSNYLLATNSQATKPTSNVEIADLD